MCPLQVGQLLSRFAMSNSCIWYGSGIFLAQRKKYSDLDRIWGEGGGETLFIYTGQKGSLGGPAVWRLPLAQGVILETRGRIPHRAPSAWSLLLSLPLSLSLSLCDYHKFKKKKEIARLLYKVIAVFCIPTRDIGDFQCSLCPCR